MTSNTTRQPLVLCVDCDGTLIHTDLLFESFLLLLKQNFWAALAVPFWLLMHGKAATKLRIAERVEIDASILPYSEPVLDYVRAERAKGRRTVLATASAQRYAQAIAEHLQVFDDVLATENAATNLSGQRKAAALEQAYGARGFEYIGNSRDDLPVWQAAGSVAVANASAGTLAAARAIAKPVFEAATPYSGLRPAFKSLRLHQWLKNLLVFVPLLAAHRVAEGSLLMQAVMAFVAYGLCASSVYILNDLLDIEADRRHATKRLRPFAVGSLSIPTGVALKLVLLSAAFAIATQLPPMFMAALGLYYAVTLSYSIRLKAQVMVDVMLLSGLYTMRILAGAAATGIVPSFWLLAFSMFIFLSLALVKRYAEMLKTAKRNARTAAGRGYSTDDLVVLLALGAASGYTAVLVLALYVNSADVARMYARPYMLWLVVPAMAYWISRVWLKTHRGEMHDDPVVFAAKDWQSLVIVVLLALAAVLAAGRGVVA
ncbi:UbiA family prenyltransferase [Aquabacterium sp. OR-4]|uniref:UbiA family prenyltransferase n=1 Tax=Aquabacterium sp. OR-4 TaxID=2978127 RepID=UPI0021B18592|nr:UbiA family prenyltransferase [Aquabacterium sp. OR-4]MDT7835873.1 UbiA family prenyltransferase [Aquabacterium sp. OR-4]